MVYSPLLPLMRTPRLPAVEWTDAPADLNGLVRFAERRNLVSARVPSHFERSLPHKDNCGEVVERLFFLFNFSGHALHSTGSSLLRRDVSFMPQAPYTHSVKLSDFTVWRHTWRKNWVNCAVLTDSSADLRTILSSRISHRELRSLLRGSHSFLSLPATTTTSSSQGTYVSTNWFQQMSIAWYIPFQIPLLVSFPSKQQTTALFLSTIVTRTRRHRELTKTDRPNGKPVVCQRTFISVFRAVIFFFTQLNCPV